MKPILAVFTAMLLLAASATAADVLVLTNSERLVGQLLNPTESPRKQYLFQPADGAKVTLDASQVQMVTHMRPEELEYERIRPTYADTAAAQWELAQWCRDHQLKAQREVHLRRVIELEPNNVEAHHALGEIKIDGRWISPDEDRRRNGYVFYKGKWMTSKEAELQKEKKEFDAAQLVWCQKVKRWRGWMNSGRDQDAAANLRAIDEPMAVKALGLGLHDDDNSETRMICAEVLAKIDNHDAAGALAYAALYDSDNEVRQLCVDLLQTKKRPDVVTYFTTQLKPGRERDNEIVNRAGYCLGRMKDPAAVKPLIDAVVTAHKFKINPGADMNVGFGGGAGGSGSGMSVGKKPTEIRKELPNQAVLDALVAITGKNFGFDKQAWKEWYADQKRTTGHVNTRRD